jgi:hypothetical protein
LGDDFTPALSGSFEVINLTNEEGNDITYLYDSRLPGESDNVGDVDLHLTEPRIVRSSIAYRC